MQSLPAPMAPVNTSAESCPACAGRCCVPTGDLQLLPCPACTRAPVTRSRLPEKRFCPAHVLQTLGLLLAAIQYEERFLAAHADLGPAHRGLIGEKLRDLTQASAAIRKWLVVGG